MTVVEAPVRLGIALEVDSHLWQNCTDLAAPLFEQMSSGKYDECAVMELPRSVEEWEDGHRTGRKRAWKAQAHGYRVGPLDRENFETDIHRINTSAPYRQGRPMAKGYLHMVEFSPLPKYPCAKHATRCTGVWAPSGNLVAYLVMIRAGDLALVSQVLGHADHEAHGIMYLLFREALAAEGRVGPGVCVYNRWDSGTDGLRFLKARVGFQPQAVEWLP